MTPIRMLIAFLILLPTLATSQTVDPGQSSDMSVLMPVKVSFQSVPSGLSIVVDGTSRVTPYNANWTANSTHTINTSSPQAGGSGTRYVWASWSDGGAQSHTVTTPNSAVTYTATFSTQYYLTMSASPSGGGTVTPGSAWRTKGQSVAIDATVNGGYTFGSWSGSGTGSYSGTTRSTNITMNGPITEVAQFSVIQSVLSVTPIDRGVSSDAGSAMFAVVNAGAGTMNWTAASDQAWATITSGSSGSNNGTVTVSYTANSSPTNTRIATITVTASGAIGSPQSVTITQSPSSASALVEDSTSLSDDFFGTGLDGGLWTFVNPLGDVTLSVANNELAIEIPGILRHEPWMSGNTAPRITQNVDPSMNVNVWTVRFNSLPAGSASSIPMEGMFFEQDLQNYVRVDVFSDGTAVYAFAAGFLTGPSSANTYFNVPIPATSAPLWICVTRSGSLWRVYISLDGATSFLVGSFDHIMTLRRVGMFAGNAGDSPQAFTCLVDYFQGALPAKPFPTTPDSGAAGVARPVIFAWDSTTAASMYRLQVASDSNFSTLLFDSTIIGTSTTVGSLQSSQECWWRVKGGNNVGWGEFSEKRWFTITSTGVQDETMRPYAFSLEQNWPNPFNPVTMIQYTVGGTRDEGRGAGEAGAGGWELGAGVVTLKVYDLLGREVSTLVNEPKAPGSYTVRFDASKLASGVYLYRMTAGAFTQTRRLILLR